MEALRAHPPCSQIAEGRVVGVILAGGRSTRMGGGDKFLIRRDGRRLIDWTAARLAPQVTTWALSLNGDPARLGEMVPAPAAIMPDDPAWRDAGPLAGVLAGLVWAESLSPRPAWMVSVAADAPLIPADLVARLLRAATAADAPLALARSGDRLHPTHALWRVSVSAKLLSALAAGERSPRRFAEACGAVAVDWDCAPYDPFLNLNRPEDLAAWPKTSGKDL